MKEMPKEVIAAAKAHINIGPPFGPEVKTTFDALAELCRKHKLSIPRVLIHVINMQRN